VELYCSGKKPDYVRDGTQDALRRENMLPKWAPVREGREKADAETTENG